MAGQLPPDDPIGYSGLYVSNKSGDNDVYIRGLLAKYLGTVVFLP